MKRARARMGRTFLGATPVNVLKCRRSGRKPWKGFTPPRALNSYEDTAKGKVKDWLANYKKMFAPTPIPRAIIGYNAIETLAFYAKTRPVRI